MSERLWSTWIWRLALITALLWLQQAGLRHDLEHAQLQQQQDLAAHALCQECLSHHGAQAALPATPHSLVVLALPHGLASFTPPISHTPAATQVYQSRAPPTLSA